MCLAQGPQRSDAGEVRTRGLSVSSQALYHWATALPSLKKKIKKNMFSNIDFFPSLCRVSVYSKILQQALIDKSGFFYFSTKTYFVGTQKNRLNETVLLSTQNKS